ncbi:kynurenine formamidase isoform X2 [Alligator mississippiensis]|uniref:kynurenine formamidase isoform X2 n=1 Tax=Alligator mississippiensis TaxID=8496 RepID=UPI00287756B9|nr:kynurenine formamidase isoform X2 [Alligator mississippiensis]
MGRWQELSREELERQYSPSRWSPRLGAAAVVEAHVREVTAGTRRARAAAGAVLQVPYGTGEREALDVYLPAAPAGAFPLVLYVHGGYWQFLSKEESGFAALPLLSRGIALVAVGYDVAPRGNMDVMVAQVRRSVACIVRQYPTTSGVYLCGHSAGAHLAAMVLATDWQEYGVAPDIKGAFLVSGIYDLEPIVSTYVNDALRMTPPWGCVVTSVHMKLGFSLPHGRAPSPPSPRTAVYRLSSQRGCPEEQSPAARGRSDACNRGLRGAGCRGPARLP